MVKAGWGVSVLGIVLAVWLTGCTPATNKADPSRASTPAQSQPSRSPTPTPTPTAPPALSDLLLSPNGLGPLAIGSPVPSETAPTALVTWNQSSCAGSGEWEANYPSGPVFGGTDAPFSFASDSKTDPIVLLFVWSNAIRTDAGVGVGSSVSDLMTAYPQLAAPIHASTSDLYVVKGTTGKLVFEVATRFVAGQTEWPASAVGTVVWAYVEPATDASISETAMQGGAHCLD